MCQQTQLLFTKFIIVLPVPSPSISSWELHWLPKYNLCFYFSTTTALMTRHSEWPCIEQNPKASPHLQGKALWYRAQLHLWPHFIPFLLPSPPYQYSCCSSHQANLCLKWFTPMVHSLEHSSSLYTYGFTPSPCSSHFECFCSSINLLREIFPDHQI